MSPEQLLREVAGALSVSCGQRISYPLYQLNAGLLGLLIHSLDFGAQANVIAKTATRFVQPGA